MKRGFLGALLVAMAVPGLCWGQVSGNANYGQNGGKARAEQNERSKRTLSEQELPPTATGTFVEANVMINVKADEYVAMFALAAEAPTVEECGKKMDATVKAFTDRVKALGVTAGDLYVDFVAQTKTYDFAVIDDIASEKLTGFELKKNISIHYKDPALLDKLLVAAAQSQVYDLIKVDYVVKDIARIQEQLVTEAARIIKQKTARYEKLFGLKFLNPPQIYAERPSIYYPANLYDSYVAAESESLNGSIRNKYTIKSARKTRTFYFNALDADGYDTVINPVIIEPVVQFTLYLKVRYDSAADKPQVLPRPASGN